MTIVAAKDSFVTKGRRHVRVGELFDSDHDLVRRLPDLFEPIDDTVRVNPAPVEAASAAPGERRTTSSKPVTSRQKRAGSGDS